MSIKLNDLDTPFLWVDLNLLEKNILSLSSFFRKLGINWRPHTKGIKIPPISHMLLSAGASGITCAKLSEAEVMAKAGINNILIANQVVGSNKIKRLGSLAKKIHLIVAVDNENIAREMDHTAQMMKVKINVLVEVNVGQDRAGVESGPEVLALSKKILEMPGLNFDGIMAWEGHAAGIADVQKKKEAISESMSALKKTIKYFEEEDIPLKIISGAGSATYQISTGYSAYNEIQAGGAVFTDQAYQTWGVPTEPSLFVRSTITSRPTKKRIITDAGFKTVPGWIIDPLPLINFEIASVSMSSEHGEITLIYDDTSLKVGEKFNYQVGYGDVTVFLHDKLYGCRNGFIEKEWDIEGRGRIT